jgi:hypothetical protein
LASTNIIELRYLSLMVEGEVRTNYGNEDEVEGDDECKDNDGNVREEAPNDSDVLIQHLHGLDSNILCRLDLLCLAPNGILEEDE